MAKVLHGFRFRGNVKGSSAYDRYLDGQVWEIDFAADHPGIKSKASLLACINVRARRSGLKVRSSNVKNENLIVQSYNPEPESAE